MTERKTAKNKLSRKKVPMAVLDPEMRAKTFDEVALGYNSEEARREAARCLNCSNAPCMTGCPVSIDIPGFVALVKEGKFREAAQKIRESNNLPAICGRVCPQELNCESRCVLGKKGQPLAIGRLERFVADWERENGWVKPSPQLKTGKKVAVVGSGPAGLTAAADLAVLGYEVTIFEALHLPGGVLSYGIPEFRLPKKVVAAEIDYVKSLGVKIEVNTPIGKLYTLHELKKEYDAVFLSTGAGLPRLLSVPGEHLNGIYTANEFLTRVNLMKAYLFPSYATPVKAGRRTAVIGGGNVALDAARAAIRLGAKEAHVLYRRTALEMPARAEEYEQACIEGVHFDFLVSPLEFQGDESGWVKNIICLRYALGEPDSSGRRRPEPIPGTEFALSVDTAIVAIGQSPNILALTGMPELLSSSGRFIGVNLETGATKLDGIYAGGDLVTGAATVIEAMSAGKKAAAGIHCFLSKGA